MDMRRTYQTFHAQQLSVMKPPVSFALLVGIQLMVASATDNSCHLSPCSDSDKEEICECISNCSFRTLETEMWTAENQYKLWTTFHHPREAFPQLLVVRYSTNSSSGNQTCNDNVYLWTSNSIYFVVPPHVFGMLTLFLGILDDDHTGTVNLTLPDNCSCWLSSSYKTDDELSTMNYLEVLTEKLRWYAFVLNFPPSVSTYQFRSSAVKVSEIPQVFHNKRNIVTFFSFMVGLPLLTTVAFFIIVVSLKDYIEERMSDQKEHQNFAALISVGVTFAWFATIVDIIALILHENRIKSDVLYISSENKENELLLPFLIASTVLEITAIAVFDILPLLGCCKVIDKIWSAYAGGDDVQGRENHFWRVILSAYAGGDDVQGRENHFWTFMFPLIPPLWCFSSRFGFIIVAWTSFVRHSTAFTVFYIFAFAILFIITRQTYRLVVRSWYKRRHNLNNEQIDKRMKDDGISIAAIWIVRIVGAFVVLVYAYLMFGLWLLPVTEVVEDAPVYLNDALQLIFVVLAALISYKLFSIKDPQPPERAN